MALRPLHLLGSPMLRTRAAEIGTVTDAVRRLVDDLFDTMRAAQGIGLAANQVGATERVAVVDSGEGEPIVLINPVIVEREGTERAEEGCLSIPDLYGDVDRATKIVVETTTPDGGRITVPANALTARAVQHEIDHLDGILFIDHLSLLRRRMLLKKWRKARAGEHGYLKEVAPPGAEV
ncbi:MAG TPA: peptide deformylase [Gemmatimonadales bacterium]